MSDLDALFTDVKRAIDEGDAEVDAHARRRRSVDRSFIAYLVVGTFVLIIVMMAVRIMFVQDWAKDKEPLEYLLTVLSSVLLPVVTLVIGHYFGKESGQSGKA
jgi:uncharacterized membrane protein